MVCHVCANTQSHYSVVVQAKFPLSKVRVITSGSGPPVFTSGCHSAFHVTSTRYFLLSVGECLALMALLSQGKAWHGVWMSPVLSERK